MDVNKVLLFGSNGKMGTAVKTVFRNEYEIVEKNSNNFDAADLLKVEEIIKYERPDILINAVAYMGIDNCENNYEIALKINTIYPQKLAFLSNKYNFLLVHFSTESVYNDTSGDYFNENDLALPLNLYGLTKFGGDCFISNISKCYYIFRLPVLFGPSNKKEQFVEKMICKMIENNATIKVASDVISTPSYSLDVAKKIMDIIESKMEYGLYIVANDGKASLFDLINEIRRIMGYQTVIEEVSCSYFPTSGVKNKNTPIKSKKISAMRSWKSAVLEYCNEYIKEN